MAYTEPQTWPVGGDLLSAEFNREIRDNFRAMGPHLIARLTSDQTQANGVFADTLLTLPVAGTEVWYVDGFLLFDGSNNASLRWTFPTSGTLRTTWHGTNSGGTLSMFDWNDTTSPATNVSIDGTGNAHSRFFGLYINGGNAGNLAVNFAGNGGNATLKANSLLYAVKLA